MVHELLQFKVRSVLVRESHTSFLPPALRAPKMSVFHSVDLSAFLAIAPDLSVRMMAGGMLLHSRRGTGLAAGSLRRRRSVRQTCD